ncbi:3329_t:CDS:2 [Ambispora leptoticha]|uniref:3329_t:CDS:1 n=1 Tax=Ambispora leptoticha TaxID=144679 RepID=A0A9N8WTE8_9GLOM|nr:3329_t:CDS:2 [Ambispora leptoticha]
MSSDTPTSDFEYEEIPNKVIIAKTQEVCQAYQVAGEAYKQASEALRNAAQKVEELRQLLPEDMCIQLPSDFLSEFPTRISSASISSSSLFQPIVLPDLYGGVKEKISKKKSNKKSKKRVRHSRQMKCDSNSDVLAPIEDGKNENQLKKVSSNSAIRDRPRPVQEIENNKEFNTEIENENPIEIRMHKFNSKNTNDVNRNLKKSVEGFRNIEHTSKITLPSIQSIGTNPIITAQPALHHQSLRSKNSSIPSLSLEIPYKPSQLPKNSAVQEMTQQFRYSGLLNEHDRKNDRSVNSSNPSMTSNQSHLFNSDPRPTRSSNNHGKMVASKSSPSAYLISDQLSFPHYPHNIFNSEHSPIRTTQQHTPETSTTTSPTTPNTAVSVQQSTIHSFFLDGIPHQSVPASNWFNEVTKHTYTPQPLSAEESELVEDFIKYAGPRLKDPTCTQAVIAQEIIDLSNNTCKMAQASVSTMMRRISVPKHPAMRRAIQSWIENERKKSEKVHMYV